MSKKLIIFDMDGTLVNSSITIANAVNYVRKNLGFEPMNPDLILSKVNDDTINSAQVFYHSKNFESDHEKWFSEYYSKNHDRELVLYDEIKELLEDLKSSGYSLAVATNAYRASTIEALSHLEIYHLFNTIACYDDVSEGKPSPKMLYKILDKLKISNSQTLFIGDGERDKRASQKANIDYIMVDWGFSDYPNAIRDVNTLKRNISFY